MDAPKPNHNLTEISHLFLSSVRDRQTGGTARPKRLPPPVMLSTPAEKPAVSIDLTPEEFAQVYAGQLAGGATETSDVRIPPVTAVIAAHLGRQSEQVKDYARHLAANGERVGVVEVDAGVFRLMCFEKAQHSDAAASAEPQTIEHFNSREMGDALEEMSWDLDRWLVLLPNPRTTEARNMLRTMEHWVLLSTCDHEGVVGCYRTLKGLSDLPTPKLSLAVLDAKDGEQAERVFGKLANVCQQFLNWPVQMETPVQPAPQTTEHTVLSCRAIHDKAQIATAAQWKVLAAFLARAANQSPAHIAAATETKHVNEHEQSALDEPDSYPVDAGRIHIFTPADNGGANQEKRVPEMKTMPQMATVPTPISLKTGPVGGVAAGMPMSPTPFGAGAAGESSAASIPFSPISRPAAPMAITPEPTSMVTQMDEVLELSDTTGSESSILSAIIRHAQAGLIECPVHPPMCPEARLAVTRERGLVMLAVARQGLTELRVIGQAYRWLVENRALIGMAVPQLSIDALQHPRLRLLVDHADLSAEILQPMLEARTVSVQAYRKLRWGAKTGLLLEAA